MPKGWVYLATYWTPQQIRDALKVEHWVREGVLCPEHARALEGYLKDLGRALDVPVASEGPRRPATTQASLHGVVLLYPRSDPWAGPQDPP
jgi:hypothetical protein